MRIAVVNLKGGVGKTTSAVHLAAALAAHGSTLLVDTDPQQSAAAWARLAGETGALPFDVLGDLVTSEVADGLEAAEEELGGHEFIVIDTPPASAPIVAGALAAAEVALVPVGPTLMEVDRIGPTVQLVADVHAQGHPLDLQVLMVRVRARTRAARVVRAALADQLELPVLRAEVPLSEAAAQAFGETPELERTAPYARVARELLAVTIEEA